MYMNAYPNEYEYTYDNEYCCGDYECDLPGL